MTIKAIGNQWYWTYQYPDHGKFSFDANMIPDDELKKGQKRLLDTDASVVVPVNTTVRVQVTAADVLHAWAIPAFGVKIDAVPGRLNETWFKAHQRGHLLRAVLRALWNQARIHADPGGGRVKIEIRCVGGGTAQGRATQFSAG